jgi:hypothetical protein
MSNVKISGLTAYTNPASSDVLPIVDLLNDQTKKITVADLLKNGFGPGTVALPSFSFIGDPDTGIYSPGANQFAVTTGGTQRLLIDASGNTTIQGDLTVNGTTTTVSSNTLSIKDKNIEIAVVSTPTDTTADGGGITLKGATDKTLTWVDSTDCWTFNQGLNLTAGTAGAPALVFNGDVNSGLFQPGADSLAIATAGAQRVTVDSSGNVGIGTASPGDYGNFADDLVIYNASQPGITLATGTGGYGSIYFADGTAGNTASRGQIQYNHSNDSLLIATAATERLRIDSSGFVGIGTTNPDSPLQVGVLASPGTLRAGLSVKTISNGLPNSESAIYLEESSGGEGYYLRVDSDGGLAFDNSAQTTPTLYLSDTNNVGIGNTTCGSILDVRTGAVGSQNAITMGYGRSANPTDAIHKIQWASDDLVIAADTGNTITSNIIFKNDNTERMRIDSSGNVELTTDSSSATQQVLFSDGTSGRGKIVYRHNGDSLAFETLSTEQMRIDSSGNVGIGTSSPGTPLDVNGTILSTPVTYASNQDQPYLIAGTSGWTGATTNWNTFGFQHRIKSNSTGVPRITIDTSTAEVFCVTNDGRVGIGTGSPQAKLHVASTGFVSTRISSDSTSETQLRFYTNTAARVSNQANTALIFDTNATERMRIDSSGNVGIGTTSPSSKLQVNGTVTATAFSGNGAALTNLPAIENSFASSAPSSPGTGDFWVDTTNTPPELKSYNGTAWVAMGSSAPTVSAPIINGVTLAEDNTSGARFTSKGFTATISMLNDGAPISQKAVKGKVTATFAQFPAMPAASSNSSSSYANGSSLTVLNRWQVDADGVRIPVNEPGRRGFLTLYRYAASNSTAQSFYFSDDMDMEWYNSGTLLLSAFGNQTTKPTYTNIVHPTNNNAITLYNAYTKDRAYVMYWDVNGAFQVTNQLGGQVLTDPDNPNSEYFQWSSQVQGSMKRMDKYPSPTTTTTSNSAKSSLGLYNVDDTFAVGNGIIVACGRSSSGNNYRPTIFTRPTNFNQNSGPTSYFFGASSNRNINFIKYVKGYFWLVDNAELFRSSTGAQSSWTSINTSYNGNGQKLKDITVDQNGHLVGVFVQSSNGSSRMMKSNNFGATWVLYGSLSNPPSSEYQSVFVANNRIYASVHTHSATINWAKVNTQTVTVSSTGGDYNEFNVGDLVKPQGSTDSGDVGKIESISGTSIGLDSQYLYQVGDVIEAINSTGTATATRYLVISGTGAISTHQASDPGYVTLNAGTSQTITFPATFPTGETPDAELPSGTTIQVDIQATNSQASDTYPSNTLTPS